MARHYSEFGFADLENARRYAAGSPRAFLPVLDLMHQLTAQMISETAPAHGKILVVGAGGGLDVLALHRYDPSWQLVGVDPSPEMIMAGQEILAEAQDRVTWIQGYLQDAPRDLHDAATCLLTLHLIPDDGSKRELLQQIYVRLKPGGALTVVDHCFDRQHPDSDRILNRFIQQARRSGIVDESLLDMVKLNTREKLEAISAERETQLLAEAGFVDIELYFAALSWRGWVVRKPSAAI